MPVPDAADGGPIVRVERPDVDVLFLEVADEAPEIQAGWSDLEDKLGSLRGRRFFGAFDAGRYRVCVLRRDGDDPGALGLRSATLPGGPFLRIRLHGEPPELYGRIPAAFATLEATASRDAGRPGIEFYRRYDEVDVLMPV